MLKFTLKYKCPVFDVHPVELGEIQLPIYKDINLRCLYERRRLGQEWRIDKEPTFFEIAEIVSTKVKNIYTKACIPTVSLTRVLQLLNSYHKKYV